MSWRGTTTPLDRVFATLAYVIPLLGGIGFGKYLFNELPFFRLILVPLQPFAFIYYSTPFTPMIVFFILFLAVVRNSQVNHFIRFNVMQAILIDIALFLCGLVMRILEPALGTLLAPTLFNTIFLGLLAAVGYSVFQSILGRYAELPGISEAVYTQVP